MWRARWPHQAYHGYFLARLAEVAFELGDTARAARLADGARVLTVEGDVETVSRAEARRRSRLGGDGLSRKAVRAGREAVATDGIDELVLRGETRLDLAEVMLSIGRAGEAAALARVCCA